ncbi:hypothetical protein DV515_00007275, partial [Chloebia gouldiae]
EQASWSTLVLLFTDLLRSPREPLALCLVFQLCDKDLESLKVAKYPQLSQFNRYYKLWIPKQSQEPVLEKPQGGKQRACCGTGFCICHPAEGSLGERKQYLGGRWCSDKVERRGFLAPTRAAFVGSKARAAVPEIHSGELQPCKSNIVIIL